jgi:CheY-like chemotaxis protein
MIDTGCAINKATMAYILSRFYTAKSMKEDKGLGSSVISGSVNRQPVASTDNSEPGKFAILPAYVPTTQTNASEAAMTSSQEESRGQGKRVLFVDDDESMVFLMERWLERLGYKVTGCTCPEKALEMFRLGPQNFDIVLSDLSMPQMSGVEFARGLLQIQPRIPIFIISGYVGPIDNEEIRRLGLPDPLAKPKTIEELGQTVHRVFAKGKPCAPDGQTDASSKPGRIAPSSGS